jgi:polyribonucleotide nucleotidyltransferase
MQFVQTLNRLLDHIKTVERETIDLTREGQLQLVKFIEKSSLRLDDEMLEVMQYQDIIAQQLSATIEAIETMQAHLDDKEVRLDEMDDKLSSVLKRAQEKHSAFGGKTQHHDFDDGVEFF